MGQERLLTLSGEDCDRNSRVAKLDERPSFIHTHPISGQQNVLGTNKAMDQLFVLLKHPCVKQLLINEVNRTDLLCENSQICFRLFRRLTK